MSSARETFKRRSKRQDQSDAPVTQTDFGSGLIKNTPHDEIPKNALAGLVNAHAFPKEIRPRRGTRIIPLTIPPITDRIAYIATKDGSIITSLSGDIFTEDDVSNYWVWPDENIHDEIIDYISATQVRVHRANTKDVTAGCWIHGRLNLWEWHQAKRKLVWQWGREIYISEIYLSNGYLRTTALIQAACVSYQKPYNVLSDWSEMDDYGVVYNPAGTYLVNFDSEPYTIFKKNSPVPTRLPDDVERNMDSKYRYDILYSMSRLEGQGLRSRITPGVATLQESGTTAIDEEENPVRDNAIIFTTRKIDNGIRTNGKLTAGTLAAAQQAPTYWAGINDASFQWTVNGRTEEFVCDFTITTGAAVTSLSDVASELQRVLRLVFYAATCYYDADNTRFIFTTGEEDGSTCGYGIAGTGGTSIANVLGMTTLFGAVVDNANIYAQPYTFGPFYIPEISAGVRDRHWSHYVLYGTPDIGPDGVSPRVGPSGEILPPLKFGYRSEVRVAGAMYGSKESDGLVTVVRGTFEEYDVGTSLEWEDGDVDTIVSWVSGTQVYVSSEYYYDPKPLQACAIGGGDVFRASQSGYIVTREGGEEFTADDVGETIWWSSDYSSIIEEFIDADTVRVRDSAERDTQGLTMAPISRMITDLTNDETIRNRFDELYVGALRHRFHYQMPNVNIGEVVPGFMVTAIRNASFVYYCQLGSSLKYLSGYHLPNRQISDKIEESIQTIKVAPNKVIIWCKGSTWQAPTNDARILTLPEFGESFAVLFFDVVDNNQGITDTGSIEKVESSVFEMVLSDNSVRQFDLFKYGIDLTVSSTGQDIIKNDLKDTWGIGCSIYESTLGHIFWRVTR